MKLKHIGFFGIAIALAAIVGGYLFVMVKPQSGHLDAEKITTAIHAYRSRMKLENQTLPATVSLRELIAKGFLKHEDVSAFDEWKVTVSLTASEIDPQSVLINAQSPDGHQIVLLADGSVQSAKQPCPSPN